MFNQKQITLVADIGGTNSIFALIDSNMEILFQKEYKTLEKAAFDDLIKEFLGLNEVKKFKIQETCIAASGDVSSDRTSVQLTNVPWTLNSLDIKKYGFKRVLLINDFEAIGYAYDMLKQSQYVELTSIGRNPAGTVAIIGAGTGLGVSILHYHKKHYPMPSEGGHIELWIDPTNKLEVGLYQYLKKNHIILDNESILSGQGIINLYNFLLSKNLKHNKKLAIEIKRASIKERPSLITKYALEEKDYLCLKVTELFIIFYARAAKNLTINTLCKELVIAGGIAPNMLPLMMESFIEAFTQHDRKHIRSILENTTILVLTDRLVSLTGAGNALRCIE